MYKNIMTVLHSYMLIFKIFGSGVICLFKAAVRNFFYLVKNDPKSIFEEVHNQQVFKTITLL